MRKEPKDSSKNVMREVRIRKLCLNICVGESGDRLTRAAKVSFKNIVHNIQCTFLITLIITASFYIFPCHVITYPTTIVTYFMKNFN